MWFLLSRFAVLSLDSISGSLIKQNKVDNMNDKIYVIYDSANQLIMKDLIQKILYLHQLPKTLTDQADDSIWC